MISAPKTIDDEAYTDEDGGIGHVEDRPEAKVKEISHIPLANAIKQVADGTAQLQTQAQSDQPFPIWQLPVVQHNSYRHHRGDQNENTASIGKHAKGSSAIRRVSDAEDTPPFTRQGTPPLPFRH